MLSHHRRHAPLRARLVIACFGAWLPIASAAAQSRTFLFSVGATAHDTVSASLNGGTLSYDIGLSDQGAPAVGADRYEHRLSADVAVWRRLIVLASVAVADAPDAGARGSGAAELMMDAAPRGSTLQLAGSVGLAREIDASSTLRFRFIGGVARPRWQLLGNFRLEHALTHTDTRDELDVITTLGYQHALGAWGALGAETVAEDLEGLTDPNEAEGGAKILVGPTLTVAPGHTHWQVLFGGGPVIRLTQSPRHGSSERDLSATAGYTIRLAAGYRW